MVIEYASISFEKHSPNEPSLLVRLLLPPHLRRRPEEGVVGPVGPRGHGQPATGGQLGEDAAEDLGQLGRPEVVHHLFQQGHVVLLYATSKGELR